MITIGIKSKLNLGFNQCSKIDYLSQLISNQFLT